MKKIWRFEVETEEDFEIEMPKDAEILCVGTLFGKPWIWAMVDPDAEKERRRFGIHGAGHTVSEDIIKYIGTFQPGMGLIPPGSLVFHLFERKQKR